MYEPRLIAPFSKSGLNKYYKPWLIGEEAFPNIQDAYAWRGTLRKREGYTFFASLPNSDKPVQGLKVFINPITLGESLIAYSKTKSYLYNVGGAVFNDITFVAQQDQATPAGTAFNWSNGDNDYFWTSNYANSLWSTNNLPNISNSGPNDHIKYWNGTPGVLNVSGGWSTNWPIVSGSTTLDGALIILPYKGRLVVLNTFEAGVQYQSRARWTQIGTPYAGDRQPTSISNITAANPAVVTSANHGLYNGQSVYLTGVKGTMGPKINETTSVATVLTVNTFSVPIDTTGLTYTSGGFAQGCGVPPAGFFNDGAAWRSDIPGRGGFIDADTSQQIVSADIVKDTLIVFFQRSTWRLRYTGNEILPFIWERLNTQYGAESTYSNIAFDDSILAFSRYGWIAADTNDVGRIDEEIPDDSFAVESTDGNLSGLTRVQGIRDYYRQFAYWTYPSIGQTAANQIYAYDYLTRKWFIFNPTVPMRTFGTYRTNNNITWSTLINPGPVPPADSWENYSSASDQWRFFDLGANANFPFILGGDANGNIYTMFEFMRSPTSDNGTYFPFTIETKDFNPYISKGVRCRLAYADLYITTMYGGQITVQHFVDDGADPIYTKQVDLYARGANFITNIIVGTPTTITTQNIHNLVTNEWATFGGIVGDLGFALNNASSPVIVIDPNTFTIPIPTSGTFLPGGVVYKGNNTIGQSWYTRVYLGAIARMHSLTIGFDPLLLTDPIKAPVQFELQGLVIWTRPEGRIRG